MGSDDVGERRDRREISPLRELTRSQEVNAKKRRQLTSVEMTGTALALTCIWAGLGSACGNRKKVDSSRKTRDGAEYLASLGMTGWFLALT
jgi:hypothetical protein